MMPVSAQTYERLALEDPESKWELYDGCLRSKPGMTSEHNSTHSTLTFRLARQLDDAEYELRVDNGKTRRPRRTYFIPDIVVVPKALVRQRKGRGNKLEVFSEPLPLVIEVWSRRTGRYDVREKLPVYMERGDLEIWLVHPYERTLIAWRRQADGSYTETLFTGGTVEPVALPGVVIDLDTLFD